MKSNRIQPIIQKALDTLYQTYPHMRALVSMIGEKNGVAYLVGGAVRDMLLGLPIKDIDIEVHGMTEDALVALLKQFGVVDFVGQSFGVFKVHGFDVDWSLPRADSAGRKPHVIVDPNMTLEDAFVRRDLTINAMGINMATGELVDPFDGMIDLENKLLRSPNLSFFAQDPLRFFRVMQFIARFDMKPDVLLEDLCKQMSISEVSRERIEQEFAKMFLRSKRPSLGIRWLNDIGRLSEVLPELADTIGVEQGKQWHPEGDVFEHTMQSLDAAAALDYASDDEKLAVLYAALCHDLGKVSTTVHADDGIHSYGHERESEKLTRTMLKRIMCNKQLLSTVTKLVRWHMVPLQFIKQNAKLGAYKRLATKLAPETTIAVLAKLVVADKRGRNAEGQEPLITTSSEVAAFLDRAEQAHVKHQVEPALLTGRDFLDVVKPGPLLGQVVKKAYELQLDGITDVKELKKLALQEIKKDETKI